MGVASADLLQAGLSLVGGISLVLGWGYYSTQVIVPRTLSRSLGIATRIGVVYVVCLGVACAGMGLRVGHVGLGVTIALALMLNGKHLSENLGTDALGAAIWIAVLSPVFLLQVFVLGVLGDEPVQLAAPQVPSPSDSLLNEHLIGAIAHVVSPLKPTGIIEIQGQRLAARAHAGGFIASGTRVRICGEQQRIALVRAEIEP